jgi:hypothetical protein
VSRRLWFKRWVVALMLAAFVPVVSAVAACQALCAMESGSADAGADDVELVGLHDAHHVPAGNFSEHLKHSGPCHLSAVPVLVGEPDGAPPFILSAPWRPFREPWPASFSWPPPKPRPRA